MDRKQFLKNIAIAGAVTAIDLSSLSEVMAQNKSASSTDLVAVMNGTPEGMLDKMLESFGGIEKFVKKGQTVVLKPNIGWDKAPEMGANTTPELVGAMVRKCLKAGAKEVQVFDHTCNQWELCYKNSGIKAAVEAAGGKMVPANDESYYVECDIPQGIKLKKAKIHRAILNCDVWFNMPILKTHGGAKLTISMKNYMGIVWDRRFFHENELQQCIADITSFHKRPALHIVDAYRTLKQNGPRGKSIDDVVVTKALFASADPVAVDTAALRFFNQVKSMPLEAVSHIQKAESLNLGTTNLNNLNIKRIKL